MPIYQLTMKTLVDYFDFSADCAHNFKDYANTPDDQVNNVANLVDIHDISSLHCCIPNLALLQLLFIYR
jgi:hypothetical protein